MYFDLRIILHYLSISSLHEIGFSRFINSYIKTAYYNICDDYDVNVGKTWMNEIGFTQQNMVFLVMEERPQKGLQQTTLHDR